MFLSSNKWYSISDDHKSRERKINVNETAIAEIVTLIKTELRKYSEPTRRKSAAQRQRELANLKGKPLFPKAELRKFQLTDSDFERLEAVVRNDEGIRELANILGISIRVSDARSRFHRGVKPPDPFILIVAQPAH